VSEVRRDSLLRRYQHRRQPGPNRSHRVRHRSWTSTPCDWPGTDDVPSGRSSDRI